MNNVRIAYGPLTEIAAPVVDEKSWDAIIAEEPEVAGKIISGYVRDNTTDRVYDWTDFPVTLPIGLPIEISARAENTGDYDQEMTLTAKLTDPSGILRGTSTNTEIVGPGDHFMSYPSEEIVLDKSGTWVLHVTLEAVLA